jgi:hypothetical protein
MCSSTNGGRVGKETHIAARQNRAVKRLAAHASTKGQKRFSAYRKAIRRAAARFRHKRIAGFSTLSVAYFDAL